MMPTIRKTFGTNGFGVSSHSLGKPAAVYPGAIATDAQLKVAVDRQQTTLSASLNDVAATMTVMNASAIVANTLLSIDNEIVSVTAAPTGNVVPISRGFDGTAPAIHLSGATVSGFVDAWHHNALIAEIEAIEQTLGANLSRVSGLPLIVSTAYDFPAQTPGGNLIVGNNAVTLSPVPLGVNGTDLKHYLYVSGGTGTPEAVLITGGTAVSGAPSGNVIINCANAHSGAWTIQSATAGIQEAVNTSPAGMLYIPPGNHSIYATIDLEASQSGWNIFGATQQGAATLNMMTNNVDMFHFNGTNGSNLSHLRIAGTSAGTGWAVVASGAVRCNMSRLFIENYANGIRFTISNQYCVCRDIDIISFTTGGFLIETAAQVMMFDNLNIVTYVTGAQYCYQSTAAGSVLVTNSQFIGNGANYGVYLGGTSVQSNDFVACSMDHCVTHGLFISPAAGGQIGRCRFLQCWMSSCGNTGVKIVAPAGTSVTDLLFQQCQISDNALAGMDAGHNCQRITVQGCVVIDNHSGAGIGFDTGSSDISITGNTIGNYGEFGAGGQQYGIFVSDVARLLMSHNILHGNTTYPVSAATLSSVTIIEDNIGIDDVVPTLASAGTVALPLSPVIKLTGGTAITTVQNVWSGRQVTFVKFDAGSLTLGGGGNIPGTHTLTQYQNITLTCDELGYLY